MNPQNITKYKAIMVEEKTNEKFLSKKRQEEAKRDKKISHTEYLEELMQK